MQAGLDLQRVIVETRQARHSQGNLTASLLSDSDRTFWTRTVWTTESAMKNFMLTGAHRQGDAKAPGMVQRSRPGPLGTGERRRAGLARGPTKAAE